MKTKLVVDPQIRQSLSDFVRALEVAANDSFIVSILLLSRDGHRLGCLVAPSLPDEFCTAIEGQPIGPEAGSCGTAAYLGHDVYVHDVTRSPLWSHYRHLAVKHGLMSCWSTPIMDEQGDVVATFAVYHRKPSSPSAAEQQAIHLAAKALLPLLQARPKRPHRVDGIRRAREN